MLKKLLVLISIFALSFGMDDGCDQEIIKDAVSITEHADVWRHVARFLPGNDVFLNTDIARILSLDKEVQQNILQSFFECIDETKDKNKVLRCIKLFFNTTHLDKEHASWTKYFKVEKNFINHFSTCKVESCDTCKGFLNTDVIKKIKKISKKTKSKNRRCGLSQICVARLACLTSLLVVPAFACTVITVANIDAILASLSEWALIE